MKEIYKYEFSYLSEIFMDCKKGDSFRTNTLISAEPLKCLDTVVIYKKGRGLFLGRIEKDLSAVKADEKCEYEFVQHIDLSDFFFYIDRKKQKKELEEAMKIKLKQLDKEKKYEYYAVLDEDFKSLYDKYKSL